jgi:hypothetical protein
MKRDDPSYVEMPSTFGPWRTNTSLKNTEILRRLMDHVPAVGAISEFECRRGPYRDLRYVITKKGFRLRWRLRTWIWAGDFLWEKGLGDPWLQVCLTDTKAGCEVDFRLRQGPFGWRALLFMFPLFFVVAQFFLGVPDGLWIPLVVVAAVISMAWLWQHPLSSRLGSTQRLLRTLIELTHPETEFVENGDRLEVCLPRDDEGTSPEKSGSNR